MSAGAKGLGAKLGFCLFGRVRFFAALSMTKGGDQNDNEVFRMAGSVGFDLYCVRQDSNL